MRVSTAQPLRQAPGLVDQFNPLGLEFIADPAGGGKTLGCFGGLAGFNPLRSQRRSDRRLGPSEKLELELLEQKGFGDQLFEEVRLFEESFSSSITA